MTNEGLKVGQEKGRKGGRQEGIQIGHEKGKIEGIAEGEQQTKITVAKNLLKAGVSVDLIAESTGLPQAEITQLKKEETF